MCRRVVTDLSGITNNVTERVAVQTFSHGILIQLFAHQNATNLGNSNHQHFQQQKNKSITTKCASGALDVEPMVILSSVKIVEQVSYISVWLTNNNCEQPFVSNASVTSVMVLQSSLETVVPVESVDPTLNKL